MDRNMCNVVGLGGWVVDSHGDAVAYRVSGPPVMGDAELSSVEPKYYIPNSSEITTLFHNLTSISDRISVQNRLFTENSRRAINSLTTPWARIDDNIRSFTAVSKLHEMGHLLNTMPVFNAQLLENLRANLGGWRGKFDIPDVIFTDPIARHDFYIERGFDASLTDFPTEAFEQAIDVTGIKTKQPPLIQTYGFMPQQGMVNDEGGVKRTNNACILLRNFESQVRYFIDSHMKPIFGEYWPKNRTTGEIYSKWCGRRDKAQNNGEEVYPLIAYADFTDYELIITRKDNWGKIFKSIFQNKMSVQVSFWRLYPIRNCTMHSRLVTQDDELFLHAEIKYLLKAIRIMV